jgi:hypothetical protein
MVDRKLSHRRVGRHLEEVTCGCVGERGLISGHEMTNWTKSQGKLDYKLIYLLRI